MLIWGSHLSLLGFTHICTHTCARAHTCAQLLTFTLKSTDLDPQTAENWEQHLATSQTDEMEEKRLLSPVPVVYKEQQWATINCEVKWKEFSVIFLADTDISALQKRQNNYKQMVIYWTWKFNHPCGYRPTASANIRKQQRNKLGRNKKKQFAVKPIPKDQRLAKTHYDN